MNECPPRDREQIYQHAPFLFTVTNCDWIDSVNNRLSDLKDSNVGGN